MAGDEMKAEWLDDTSLHTCLCCGQQLHGPGKPITPERRVRSLQIFLALGLTRSELLGKHRAQLDYQSPGFAAWLEGN
jgi:hypothetical protein